MPGELLGKRALVTGAGSRGIGRAIVRAFCREHAHVTAHYFGQAIPDAEVAELQGDGPTLVQIPGDFSDVEMARNVVRDAAKAFGGLDIVVANAAMAERVPFLDISDQQFSTLIDINLKATFACVQEAAKQMVSQGNGGRIIIVSSVNQENVVPFQSHYCASKGAVRQLARSMALELAEHRINVNLIAPAATMTDMVREKHEHDAAWSEQVRRKYPLGRIARPDDFEGPAVFLAGSSSNFITGVTILVDGGFSLSR